jgi:DNA-binding beta-propeller fold protein YncE
MTRSRPIALMLAAALAAGAAACKKSETAGTGPGTPAAAVTPAAQAGEGNPKLSETAQAGARPFAGTKRLADIAVDRLGRIWAADVEANHLWCFDGSGASFGGLGAVGDGDYGLKEPSGVATAGGDDLYVIDSWNARVRRFSLAGELKGSAKGFYGPRGVAAGKNLVAVADTGDNGIVLFDASLANPHRVGKEGKGRGDFSGPVGIAIGPSGSVYVADVGNRRVQILDAQGTVKGAWPVPGWKSWCGGYVEVDSDETVYATDCTGDSVWAFNPSGKLLRTISSADDGTKFIGPSGLGIDQKNRVLYVVHAGTVPVLKISLGK